MRTEQLEYVAAVARLGSFRRAAEELHISQPALSETVRNLERELNVEIFQRGRSGASLSDDGRDLLSHVTGVIDAVDGLRRAADDQHRSSRMVRVATVNAGTSPILLPAIAEFRAAHPDTQVEIVGAQEEEIDRGLRGGSLDLGLITGLAGDERPLELETRTLIAGPPMACLRPGDPLAARAAVSGDELAAAPLIVMRAGYLMHRYLHRLLGERMPRAAYSTDGAEMGKLMVAEGLGVTVLPRFSIVSDPLAQGGFITCRPLADDLEPRIELLLRRRGASPGGRAAAELHRLFEQRARAWAASPEGAPPGPVESVEVAGAYRPHGDSDRSLPNEHLS